VSVDDLKVETFEFFKERGIRSNRIDEECKNDTPAQVLENLKLVENGSLKRAALLLFHPDPEWFVTGAFIKVGFFRTDSDLLFQDEIHGNLFEQVEKTMELLLVKYLKALISYEGLHRVETYEYPSKALREALINAVIHKDYAGRVPIQISVYADKIMMWNEGQLPENWTVEDLLSKHSSHPYNPNVARAFFRSGYIEAWGRGIEDMTERCLNAGLPAPQFDCKGSDFWITFKRGVDNEEYLKKMGLYDRQVRGVLYAKENGKITDSEYQILNGVSPKTAMSDLNELVNLFKIFINRGMSAYGISYG
jgi:ATP-dependent DNA helicase RecG